MRSHQDRVHRAIYPRVVDVLGPAQCSGCRLRLGPLCAECRTLVGSAVSRGAPAPASRLICGWPYEGAARSLVLDLKVRAVRSASLPLVEAMSTAVLRSGLRGSVVTWVPGRPKEERRRGFDHAHVLAQGLARRLGLPVQRLLDRTGSNRDQVGLSARERLENLNGAFKGRSLRVPGKAVVLVDDVLTTGATASACAGALLAAGASQVEVVVACSAE